MDSKLMNNCFQGGRGIARDPEQALHYFQQAAESGNAVAMAFLGISKI
jgi:TPR repeat protein